MLIANGDNTCTGGPADIIYIVQLPRGSFHVVFTEEHPMPGPVKDLSEMEYVRMKSKMHHMGGAHTLEEAQSHLDELREQILIKDENVVRDVAFAAEDAVTGFVLSNWTKDGRTLKEALSGAFTLVPLGIVDGTLSLGVDTGVFSPAK